MNPRVSLKTIGCRLNQAETAALAARFEAAGYQIVPFGTPCDTVVVHGCAITRNAERDSLRSVRQARRHTPLAVITMTGCPAQLLGDTLRGDSGPDLVVGQAGKLSIPDLLHARYPDRFPRPPGGDDVAAGTPRFDATRALVKVQDGCEFRCAYCIVPAARGPSVSRPLSLIAGEVRRLADCGFREVVLTGANLGCYADNGRSLVDVIHAVEAVRGIQRIRLSSIELTTVEKAVVDHMAASEKLCRFLHLPLQSGDDGILASMGRRYTRDQYRRAVEYAAEKVPGLGLGADIIVGFPGEDAAAFANTRTLIEALPFSNLHVFPYSRREGTRADTMPGQVSPPEKERRVAVLLDVEKRKQADFAASFIGKPVTVLIETLDDDGSGLGWTGEYVPARITGCGLHPNQIVRYTVAEVRNGRVFGRKESHEDAG